MHISKSIFQKLITSLILILFETVAGNRLIDQFTECIYEIISHHSLVTCSHSMRSRVYETVDRPSVRSSVAACGGFAAERRGCRRYRLTAAGAGRPAAVAPQNGAAARCSAANASNVTLTADVGCWTQTYLLRL